MVNVRRCLLAASMAVLFAGLGACATPYDYRNIKPTWAVRNSPVPVPHPVSKPSPRYAKTATPMRKALWAPRHPTGNLEVVRVAAGDSVYGIARRHGVSPSQIITLNDLRAPYHLNKGHALRLTPKSRRVQQAQVINAKHAAPKTPQGRRYAVKRGDTLYGIAQKQNVSASALIKTNTLKRPYTLRVGQVLHLPQSAGKTRFANDASNGYRAAMSAQAGTATFIWPAAGRVVSGYGVKANGLRNDGINISASQGAPVYAAASGEVIYAGDRLRAYGNLVLIRHKNGFISTYGHNQRLLVKRGDQVAQGQQIATVGATGNVAQPQLHFELRRNADAIDPMRYLGRTQMAANGR